MNKYMQTYAEKYMVDSIANILKTEDFSNSMLLNIGAGASISIEDQLDKMGCSFSSDRIDVENCDVKHKFINKSYIESIEHANSLESDKYKLAFANYVFEHVKDIDSAASEVYRVLKHDGYFLMTVPNPNAPEFFISRITPLWLHRAVRGGSGWKTYYSYKNIKNLIKIFEKKGFSVVEIKYFPAVLTYFYRFPILKQMSIAYEWFLKKFRLNALMGNVCLIFKKK